MSAGRPPEFTDEEGTLPMYRVRLEAYFEAHGIEEPTKKRALLIASLTNSAVRVVQARCHPKKVNELSYEEVVGHLEDHYAPQVNEIAASYAFFRRSQQEGESAQDFIAEIRRLAEKCNFGTSLERMLRDRIVCGVRDEDVRRSLLTQRKLTLQQAEDFVVSAQEAAENAKSMKAAEPDAVNFARHNARPGKSSLKQEKLHFCGRCGGSHSENECKHLRAVCHQCGKRGHLRRMCGQWRQGSYAMAAEGHTDGDETEALHTIAAVLHHEASIRKVKPIYKDIKWNGVPLRMLVDTGSPVSVISETVYRKYKAMWPPLRTTQLRLSCLLGELPVVGQLDMTAVCDGKDVAGTVVVVGSSGPSLCGRDTIKAFNEVGVAMLSNVVASVQAVENRDAGTKLQELLIEFADVFAPELGLCKGPPVTFQLKENACPRFCKARTVPYALRDKMSDALDQLVAQDILAPVKTAEWATPVVPVVKGDGSIRVCGDFRMTVNAATLMERYPLPRVDDIFAKLNGGEVFTTLDLRQAYNQLPLDEEAKKMTVLNTHKGLFCFNRLPFGVSSAPAIFQRRMDGLLGDIPGVQVYLDDIIIAEKRDDLSRLKQVLERLREYGLRLHKGKCKFRQDEVTFLGHRIDAKGLRPKDDNVKAVVEAPAPTSVSELKAFLGLVNYYGKFLPNLATVLAPLYALLAKGAMWKWEREQEKAFRNAKEAIVASKFLAHFDPDKPLRLECDASPVGIGAVLSHRVNGVDYPIGFRSRILTKAERNYSQLEKEALALVFGVTRFKDYLYGQRFVLVTDHKPLTGLFNPSKPIPPMAAARIQRWALFLGNYDYTLQYRKGSDHSNADALSRLPLPITEPSDDSTDACVLYSQALEETAISAREVAKLTQQDAILGQVKNWIAEGWPSYLPQGHEQLRPYFNRRTELTVSDNLVYWGHRIVLPMAVAKRMLRLLHETHPGMTSMKSMARTLFWYPGLDADIERMVKSCCTCAQASAMPPAQTPLAWPDTGERWSRLHVDFAGPINGKMVLVVVDAETKWIEAVSMKVATAQSTVDALRSMFARFGIPKTVVSDNGPQFVSAVFREFLARNGVQHLKTAPYHPQSNGLAERAVRTIKEGLKKNPGTNLNTRISQFLFRYRRTPVKDGKSPAEHLLGYQIRTKMDCITPEQDTAEMQPRARKNKFNVGEPVWMRGFGSGRRWIPGVVHSHQGSRMVTVDSEQGLQRRHLDQLRSRAAAHDCSSGEVTSEGPEECAPTSPRNASTSFPSTRTSLHNSTEAAEAAPLPQAPRKSTRPRRPPERYGFSPERFSY